MAPDRKSLDLDCGIAPARILPWLEDELALSRDAGGAYVYESDGQTCTIEVTPMGRDFSRPFALERTRLVITGTEEAVDAFMRLFTLRFISAGG